MDVWSVGCVIYELFTSRHLFPGRTNNDMLRLMMEVKGPFPKRMLKKGQFTGNHFEDDPQLSFSLIEDDPITHRPVRPTPRCEVFSFGGGGGGGQFGDVWHSLYKIGWLSNGDHKIEKIVDGSANLNRISQTAKGFWLHDICDSSNLPYWI